MYDVVCVGSATQDVFIKSDLSRIIRVSDCLSETEYLSYDYGSKVNIDHIEFLTGGGATNTSVAFARMGLASAALTKISGDDDAGRKVVAELEREGVETGFVVRSNSQPTGYSVILVSYEGDRTALTFRGANNTLDETDIDWGFLDKTRWLYMSALSGRSAQMAHAIARRAHEKKVKLAFNPGSTQLKTRIRGLAPILETTDVLILNRHEAETLTGIASTRRYIDQQACNLCAKCVEACREGVFKMAGGHVEVTGVETCKRCGACVAACDSNAILLEPWTYNMFDIFDALGRSGARMVVITDGSAGSQVFDGRTVRYFPSYSAPTVDTLGAGDAFASGFVAGLIVDGDIDEALKLGSANASSVVRYFGAKAGLVTMEEAREIISEKAAEGIYNVRKVALGQRVAK